MPLKKLLLKPGVNRENTRYGTEGGWYDGDKVRFRQGTPEVIGGWQRISARFFLGICRSLGSWVAYVGSAVTGVGTNLKFYIEQGGAYYDITPVRENATLSNPFAATPGSSDIIVSAPAHGASPNDFVTFYSATNLGGDITAAVLNQSFQLQVIDSNTYAINVGVLANASDTGNGGTVYAVYEIHVGAEAAVPLAGWGAGTWGSGTWGFSTSSIEQIRLWNQSNFGTNLILGYPGSPIYYWNSLLSLQGSPTSISIASPAVLSSALNLPNDYPVALVTDGTLPTGLVPGRTYYVINSAGTTFNLALTPGGAPITTSGTQSGSASFSPQALPLSSYAGANQVPTTQNFLLVSDVSRFIFAFGANEVFTTEEDPMLIRWSDQENPFEWEPQATNQAGGVRLSRGSSIITAIQTRQEIVVFTDSSLYSLQYLGPPFVWGTQLLGDNISIINQNATAVAGNVVYWMGIDKFYAYDGTVRTLRCDLRRFIYGDINLDQRSQIFSGTNEGFNEIWWFYCSANSTAVDKYVIYNYVEDIWTYGTMGRTAWVDSGINSFPRAATYSKNLVSHESGVDDNETVETLPIHAYITSSEFDLDDGHNFAFIYRILPDLTFRGSTAESPRVTMYLHTLRNSGSGYSDPGSLGGSDSAPVTRTAIVPVEQFTGQIYTRVRGRQLSMKIESNQVGTTWQLGAPRIDIRADGRR